MATIEEAHERGISLAELEREEREERAHWRGMRSRAREDNDAYTEGRREGRREQRAHPAGSRRRQLVRQVRDSRPGVAAREGAGFVLGLVLYALVLNYLRGGTPAVKGWLKAKFVNEPYEGDPPKQAPKPAKPSAPSRPQLGVPPTPTLGMVRT